MKEQLEESRKSKLELGFVMCANKDNIIEAKNITKGSERIVTVKYRCPTGFKSIGTYHIHPNEISRASPEDLLNSCGPNIIASCIGGVKDNKIKCYIRKKRDSLIDCTKKFNELTSLKLELKLRDEGLAKKTEVLSKERDRLAKELGEIDKKIKEFNVNVGQFNKDKDCYHKALLRKQNKYFNEIDLNVDKIKKTILVVNYSA